MLSLSQRSFSIVLLAVVPTLFLGSALPYADNGPDHQVEQERPVALGTSGGNVNDSSRSFCCSGTLGALVEDAGGNQYILSNNHVLARTNGASVGEVVNQPGLIDQNCQRNGAVADLSSFVEILFGGENEVDAAIALVRDGAVQTDGAILDIGPVSANTVGATLNQAVQKSGRTTGHTTGAVVAVDVTVNVGYGTRCGPGPTNTATFVNQIRIGQSGFSDSGDSGSLVVEHGSVDPTDGLPRAVGLLFAGSNTTTLANPIDSVLTLLGVTMVGGTPPATGSVSGTITRAADGTPIEGAMVSVDTNQSATTASDGTYSIAEVPTGDRTVTASATGFESDSAVVTVVENTDVQADFALVEKVSSAQVIADCVIYNTHGGPNSEKHLDLTIKVVDDLGNPVGGAEISISVTHNGSFFGSASGTSDVNGVVSFTANNAPNGTYVTTVTDVVATGLTFEGSTPDNAFNKGTDSTPAEFCRDASSSSATTTGRSNRTLLNEARNANRAHSARLMNIPGVVGHGVGLSETGRPVIDVYLDSENASTRARIPSRIENMPVRVVVTGPFVAY